MPSVTYHTTTGDFSLQTGQWSNATTNTTIYDKALQRAAYQAGFFAQLDNTGRRKLAAQKLRESLRGIL